MIVWNTTVELRTRGFNDFQDITPELRAAVSESKVKEGLLTVINPGSTGAITTIEFESGALDDLRRALDAIAPMDAEYEHNLRWGDGNGFSHVRAALMKPSLSVPIVNGSLSLGTWQQVVFLDFDNKSRTRRLVAQIMGNEEPSFQPM